MKFSLLFALLLYFGLGNSQTEQVTSFHSEIRIDSISQIHVTEYIDIVSTGQIFKRGIVRYLPMFKEDSLGKRKPFNYKILSVERNQRKENFHTKKEKNNLVVYVGKSNQFIDSGIHEYVITYTAQNAVDFYTNFDEFYWNINGFGWDFNIPIVSADIYLPYEAPAIQSSCYTGAYGSNQSNCTIQEREGHIKFEANNILRNQNLSVAIAVEKGFVQPPPPPPLPPPPTFLEKFGLFILAIILFIGLTIYYITTWRKHGVDPPKPTVYPLFEVPENLSPASVGIIHKERYWNDLITSSFVSLAVKGYLKIEENATKGIFGVFSSKKFSITKLKDPDESLPEEEKIILERLFRRNDVFMLEGKYSSTLKSMVDQYKTSIRGKHRKLINEGNNYKFLILPSIVILLFIIISLVISIKTNSMNLTTFIFGGISFFPFLFFILFFISRYLNWKWFLAILALVMLSLSIVLLISTPISQDNLNIYSVIGFIVFGLISLGLYQYYIKKPSKEKLRIQSLIEGFKMYLNTAETRQLQHFNPPEVTPEIFEKYLPYAIALDADEVWGQKFQDFLDKSAIEPSSTSMAWYAGSNFNAMNFGHMLSSNLSNSINTASTPPSSSSSGSFGGGFSGGGGGGGGGGGW